MTPAFHAFADGPALIHGHLGAWRDTDLIDGTCAQSTRHIPGQIPESWRLCGVQTATRVLGLDADQQRRSFQSTS
jgi:hypothetical protein